MFIIIFAIIGGFVGFLLRPSVPLIGQLPFSAVISDGRSLRGIEQLAQPYAEQSFHYLIAGTLIGAVVGLVVHLLNRQKRS